MVEKYIILDLSGDKNKIKEPTIYELLTIEYLLDDKENIEENLETVYDILGVHKKYLHLADKIIPAILNGFSEKTSSSSERNYFFGILGLLAHHNYMDLKDFMKKYTLNDLGELLKVREYYYNIINNKASDNSKFFDKTKQSETKDKEIEDFIQKMTRD